MTKSLSSISLHNLLIVCTAFLSLACQNADKSEPASDAFVQVHDTTRDKTHSSDSVSIQTFNRLMAHAEEKKLDKLPLGEIVGHVGRWFMEKPYVAGSLDEATEEVLVIKLDGFDCVTFVESTLALARVIKSSDTSFERFAEELTGLRYRDDFLNGYCSRLHYFSEWIHNNEKKGRVDNITRDLGGVRLEKTLNFMSTHRDSYPQLASSDSLFQELVGVEEKLQEQEIHYIPQHLISSIYPSLKTGDIIALATDIKGLDVVHTGFVFKQENGVAGLLHASTTRGVTVSPDLQEYVENNKRQIGILVARPKD